MILSTPNRIIALFLGFWVALAPAAIVIPAAAMTLQMSMADDARTDGCDGCPDADADLGACALMCLNAALLATTVDSGKLVTVFKDCHWPRRHPTLLGHFSTLDPAPPKPVFPL